MKKILQQKTSKSQMMVCLLKKVIIDTTSIYQKVQGPQKLWQQRTPLLNHAPSTECTHAGSIAINYLKLGPVKLADEGYGEAYKTIQRLSYPSELECTIYNHRPHPGCPNHFTHLLCSPPQNKNEYYTANSQSLLKNKILDRSERMEVLQQTQSLRTDLSFQQLNRSHATILQRFIEFCMQQSGKISSFHSCFTSLATVFYLVMLQPLFTGDLNVPLERLL